jgi:hypothetical protein
MSVSANIARAVLAPWTAVRVVARAAEDLHAVAERARRDPDPVAQVQHDLAVLLADLARLVAVAERIVTGGQDLNATGKRLDAHTVELIDGGSDLTEVAKQMNLALQQFRLALPELLKALGMVEDLEAAVESVADTVQPLKGAARGVGRLTGNAPD